MGNEKLYYILTLLVITISGNPAVGFFPKEAVFVVPFLFFLSLLPFRHISLYRQDLLLIAGFVFLVLAHVLTFGTIVIPASLGFLLKLGIAFFAMKMIPDFPRRYTYVMYYIALVSFLFFIPLFLGFNLQSIFGHLKIPLGDSDHFSIGIYNLRDENLGYYRNMGTFWEPGAFAGYLILALFFLIGGDRSIRVPTKVWAVLIAALLSTMSTTGYIAFAVLITYHAFTSDWIKSRSRRLLVLPMLPVVCVIVITILFTQVSFLGDKINAQTQATMRGEDASRITRMGNLLYDLKWISDRPLLGWSSNPETRLANDAEVIDLVSAQGNGMTGFTVKFGVTGFVLFLGFFIYNTRLTTYSSKFTFVGLVVICLLLTGEQFLNFPLFLTLLFLPTFSPAASFNREVS